MKIIIIGEQAKYIFTGRILQLRHEKNFKLKKLCNAKISSVCPETPCREEGKMPNGEGWKGSVNFKWRKLMMKVTEGPN